ncbi:MAG: chlorite dismutase family protein [Aridibacter famidurans]|nr:chlorite dismutase family protein [Aridibacter famidurans]
MQCFVGTIIHADPDRSARTPWLEMGISEKQNEDADNAGLRLVADNKEPRKAPPVEKQFVNFIFFRVNPDWRRLDDETKKVYKSEFKKVFAEYDSEMLLYSYSLVGFDSKADLMFWRVGSSLDLVQDMTARLYRTNLGSFLETTDNYLSVTRKMMFVPPDSPAEDRRHVVAGGKKYHFLYPCSKHSDWYDKSEEEREALIKENFMVGKKFQNIKIHMTHAFGFSEQEYLISFETDEPKDFLALAEELRRTPASKFTLRGMPIYTCRLMDLADCLRSLG